MAEPFDPNDKVHQEFREKAELLLGMELDPAIDVRETVDVRESEDVKGIA